MLRIDRENQSFSLLDTPTLAEVSITERYDLQEFIWNSPVEFFQEIGQQLFLVGKEAKPSGVVQDRIDILGLDREGTAVIVELKRGNHKLQMLQAISYAGMVAKWTPDQLMDLLDADRQESLSDFLEVDNDEINRQQRIILIAEAFDYSLLTAAEWLNEEYAVDIICCRIAAAKDAKTGAEYLVCSNVYPAPELSKVAIPRGGRQAGRKKLKWPDWETALSAIKNDAVKSYFEHELAGQDNREPYLRRRMLRYRVGGKRRWFLSARNKNGYVWQKGRFEGDVAFWRDGVSQPEGVGPVDNAECLRVFLYTPDDFQFFHDAVSEKLQSVEWLEGAPEEELEESEMDA